MAQENELVEEKRSMNAPNALLLEPPVTKQYLVPILLAIYV